MQNGTPQNGLLRIRLPNRDQQPHPTPQVSLQMPACCELDPVFVVCVRLQPARFETASFQCNILTPAVRPTIAVA